MKFPLSLGLFAGVDEAGRGCLAGPVFAAAVILNPDKPISGLRDSKKLSSQQREKLKTQIRQHAMAFSVGTASAAEVDEVNVLQASLLAMRRAILGLQVTPSLVVIDGNKSPCVPYPTECVVKADTFIDAVSAASILAKTARDNYMKELANRHPLYGFDQNFGYPTERHKNAILKFGLTQEHRKTFAPNRLYWAGTETSSA